MEVIIRKNVLYIAERFSPTKAPRLNLFLEVILFEWEVTAMCSLTPP